MEPKAKSCYRCGQEGHIVSVNIVIEIGGFPF